MPVARARGERGQPFVVHASRRLHPETHGIEVAHPCINGCKLPGGMARPSYNKRQGEACTYECAVTWRQRRQAAEWRVVLEEEERTKQLAEAVAAGQRHNRIQDEAEEEEDDSGKRPAAPRDKKSSAVGAALAAGNTRKRQKKAPAAEAQARSQACQCVLFSHIPQRAHYTNTPHQSPASTHSNMPHSTHASAGG